jgi:2,4-dienoyl-CoA reductase (NADPH2)
MRLWEPLSIEGMHLANRLVMLATHLGYCGEDGRVTEQLLAFYRERARHHPGLIIVGGCYTEHLGMSSPTMIGISSDEHIEGLRSLVESIHEFDVPVAAQLFHAGRYAHSLMLGESAVSASAVQCRLTREVPRALTREEISSAVTNFGLAATRAVKAGFDAVEVLGSSGYIINQFMATATNKRRDEYGGSLKARAKFALEVVSAVREAVGNRYPIIYRISGEDFVPDGMTLQANKTVVPWLVDAGINVLSVTGGWHETKVAQITMDVPRGHFAYLAEELASTTDVPVIASNRISSVSVAEHILSRGAVQLIGMSRALLSDPELPEKGRRGERSRTRPCVACNQGCLDQVFMLEPATCALNPLAGHETSRSLGQTGSGTIVIVGGGPAGMEAARVFALRGFDVVLFEERDHIGGSLRLAARVPGRGEFAAYVSYMERELRHLGVDIRTGTRAAVPSCANLQPVLVVCATGTLAGAPAIDGVERPHVTTAFDVLEYRQELEGDVAIIGGSGLGCHLGLFLASTAREVHIFDEDEAIGIDLGRTSRPVILRSLIENGVSIHTEARVTEILKRSIDLMVKGVPHTLAVDSVVLATRPQPNDRLAAHLEAAGMNVLRVGSVTGRADLLDCIHGAFESASKVSP